MDGEICGQVGFIVPCCEGSNLHFHSDYIDMDSLLCTKSGRRSLRARWTGEDLVKLQNFASDTRTRFPKTFHRVLDRSLTVSLLFVIYSRRVDLTISHESKQVLAGLLSTLGDICVPNLVPVAVHAF